MKKLSPVEQRASSKVLDELRKSAQGMMHDKMKGLKKVTVASDSKEGLKQGLSKAEDILDLKKKSGSDLTKSPLGEELGKSKVIKNLDEAHPDEIDHLSSEHEADESNEFEDAEQEGMQEGMEECKTPEEIDARIKQLLDLKKQLLSNR